MNRNTISQLDWKLLKGASLYLLKFVSFRVIFILVFAPFLAGNFVHSSINSHNYLIRMKRGNGPLRSVAPTSLDIIANQHNMRASLKMKFFISWQLISAEIACQQPVINPLIRFQPIQADGIDGISCRPGWRQCNTLKPICRHHASVEKLKNRKFLPAFTDTVQCVYKCLIMLSVYLVKFN